MATPTLAQARSHQAERSQLAAAGAAAVASSVTRRVSWVEVLTLFATYQLRMAALAIREMATWNERTSSTNAAAFAGTTSYGFAIAEPLVATIDRISPAPVEPLPAPWWTELVDRELKVLERQVELLVESELKDAARSAAQVELNADPLTQLYVRMLTPPSCKRCVALAGRIYSDLDGFRRHPACDCVHVPVTSRAEARDRGLVPDARQLVEDGMVRGLSAADTRAVLDGADFGQVVNATRGTSQPGITEAITADVFGRRVKATTAATTKRAAWRKANPSRLVRLRPEAIYAAARDRGDALRLLRLYGYLPT